ncbi:MAG: DMT family transporter [Clostridiales Family XIII bacterium]|jgi:drug/metabolite transporter (DMT)-like permease|nr:DMT family transporter [Clostridiales Family XIII bacterium]
MNKRTKAILLLLLAGLLWSTGGVIVKTSTENPFVISSVRGLVAAVVFFFALKCRPKFTFSKPQVIGAFAYSFVLTGFVVATSLTTAANAILLEFTSPIYIAIIGFFVLKEKLHRSDYLAVVGVLIGMILLMSNNIGGGSVIGNIVAASTGLTYGIFIVCLRLQKDGSPYETVLLGNVLTFLIGAPFIFMYPPELGSMLPIVFMGVFQIAVPYLLMAYASKYAKAIDIPIITSIEPLLNPVWVFIFTGENPGIRGVIGGGILLATVVLKSISGIRQTEPK